LYRNGKNRINAIDILADLELLGENIINCSEINNLVFTGVENKVNMVSSVNDVIVDTLAENNLLQILNGTVEYIGSNNMTIGKSVTYTGNTPGNKQL
jgi:hypothetical protein